MITVESVSKIYSGKPAVDDIFFRANDNEILVLLGTSGCGGVKLLLNARGKKIVGSMNLFLSNLPCLMPDFLMMKIKKN